MGSVARLLQSLDGSIPLQVLDRAGRDPATDTHFHGLARSVMFNVEGLVAEGLEQRDRHGAFALLVAMSMLHGTQTPHSLFRQPLPTCSSTCMLAQMRRRWIRRQGHPDTRATASTKQASCPTRGCFRRLRPSTWSEPRLCWYSVGC